MSVAKNPFRIAVTAITAAVAALACAFLVGCGGESAPSLRCDGVELCVGESRDVLHYMDFTRAARAERGIDMSTDGDCIEVSGTVFTAVKSGECTVTVKHAGGESSFPVVCAYRAAGDPTVFGAPLVQTASALSSIAPVEFTAAFAEPVDPELAVEWTVDGERSGDGRRFVFEPNGYGEFCVRASAAGRSVSATVRVYKPAATVVTVDGECEQHGVYSEVTYTARHASHPDNPPASYVWRVNGNVAGREAVFRFMPSAPGEYEIALEANGAGVPIQSGTVVATGEPAAACEVRSDDRDGVYVEWAGDAVASRVSIVAPDGSRVDLCSTDARHAYLFGHGSFDATDFVVPFASTPGEYKITVCLDGVSECRFTQYPLAAKEYAEDTPFIKNRFVSDAGDGCELVEDAYALGSSELECYIADGSRETLDAMTEYAAFLGMPCRGEIVGCVARLSFGEYVNAPTEFDEMPDVTRMYTELPHIEYDAAARRPQSYTFAIDRIKRGVRVESSAQLVTAAARGLRPEPAHGSVAQSVYSSVRAKLAGIIGVGYTARQKVHAVYDWLQWVTVCVADGTDRSSACNYVESVFGYSTMQGGDARRAVVTSEGMAKCFSLMCAVEGIECITCATVSNGVARYSNKVKLGGLWYNVDAFGGKVGEDELGLMRPSQLGTHRGLLTDDDTAARLGISPAGGEYAAFDNGSEFYLDKSKSGGAYVDRYITENDETIAQAVASCFGQGGSGSVTVPVIAGIETYMVSTCGAELRLFDGITDKEVAEVCDAIRKAADEYAVRVYGKPFPKNAVKLTRVGNCVHVAASVFGMSAENAAAEVL